MRLEAHKHNDNLVLYVRGAGGYDAANAVRQKVRGSRYVSTLSDRAADEFAYKYPLSPDVCVAMREAWGDVLKVHRDLSAWYRVAAAKRAEQVAITTQADAELPVLAKEYPAFNSWLKGDQRVTARWIANLYRNGGLLADEVGTGKTAGVVAGLIEAGVTGSIMVACPKISVKAVWGKEFGKHTDLPVFLARGTRKAREKAIQEFMACEAETAVLVVVMDMLAIKGERQRGRLVAQYGHQYPELFDEAWDAIVVDESQNVMGSMDVVKGTFLAEGLKQLNTAPECKRLAVSATPFGKGGKVEALFGTLHWLWPDEFTSKWAWLGKYFDVQDEQVYVKGGRGATKTVKRVGDLTDEERLWRELGPRVLRRTMEEVSPEHKGLKNWVEVPCEMTTAQTKQYERFTEDAELPVEGGIISTVGVLDFLTRSRQFANGVLRKEGGRVVYTGESGKFDRLEQLLDQHSGRKIVIASQYNEFLDALEARLVKLGLRWYRLDGKTTETARASMMGEFQGEEGYRGTYSLGPEAVFRGPGVTCRSCNAGSGKPHGARCPVNHPRLFLLNGQAGGVSITLDAADVMICLDEMFPPEANTQLFGRVFRRGRVHEVIYYLMRSMGTIDEQIGYKVEGSAEKQRRLLDGRRGLEYARELARYKG